MGNFEVLARRFADANLHAEVVERQTQRVSSWTSGALAADVFQMTILGKGREEYFRIWPGARTNRIEAEGIDPERRQLVLMTVDPHPDRAALPEEGAVGVLLLATAGDHLLDDDLVLMVQEPVRTFEEQLSKRRVELDRTKVKVVREDRYFVWIEHRTDARKRHFLCGRDERQLFICQLPRAVTTVRDAHTVLRAPEAMRSKGKVARQGEWFFVEPTAKELDALASALCGIRTIVRRSWPIGRGGNPHVADQLVVVPAAVVGKKLVARAVFARGRVRHVDHDTVYLSSWAKVVRNTEPVADDGIARMDGIRWID